MSAKKAVLGLVRTHAQADAVIAVLLETGFVRTDISALYKDRPPTGDFAHGQQVKGPEHTVAAASVGGVVGTTLGLLAGLGALAIPGLGPFIAAGPIAVAISGLVAGAALGSIGGALVGMGISDVEASQYESKINDGAILLSIHIDDSDQRAQAKKVLEEYGATNVSTVGDDYIQQSSAAA